MKKALLFALLFAASMLCADDDYRLKYKEAYGQMQDFHKNLYFNEAIGRSEHFGLGLAGNLLFDIDWNVVRQSELRQGFVSVNFNYWFHPLFNAIAEGGFHRSADRDIWTVSAMVQFVGPNTGPIERNPAGVGLELGFKSYLSNVPNESLTCFKIGFCNYSFIAKNIATEYGVDWLTPSFLGNSFEVRAGLKYFFY